MAPGRRVPLRRQEPIAADPVRASVGLLGGSFNPAHRGHLHLSVCALKRLRLREIWWLVSPQNPLKPTKGLGDYSARIALARTTARHPKIRVLDFERRHGLRYTWQTLRMLRKYHPRVRFVWLMGADNLVQFDRWRRWHTIAGQVPIAVFDRAPFGHKALRSKTSLRYAKLRVRDSRLRLLPCTPPPAWGFVHMKKDPSSSTAIRKKLGIPPVFSHNVRTGGEKPARRKETQP